MLWMFLVAIALTACCVVMSDALNLSAETYTTTRAAMSSCPTSGDRPLPWKRGRARPDRIHDADAGRNPA